MISCHQEKDGFPFKSGASQGFLVMSSSSVEVSLTTVASALLVTDKKWIILKPN